MTFKVSLSPSGHSYQAPAGMTVLDAGLEAGMNLPYSCRAGTCRTCKGRVVQGTVDFGGAHPFYLTEEMKSQGYALLCKAKPLSDIVVEIEELNLRNVEPKIVPCRLKRMTRPAPDVAILGLRLPMNENLRFSPGQFIDILLPGGATRSYSIASAPRAEGVIDLELHVRHTPGGLFTDALFDTYAEGDMLKFRGPLGSFYLREDTDRPIIFVASGTGLAPIKAMVDYAVQRKLTRPMKLYWGGRRLQDLYLHDLVRGWQDMLTSFEYVPVLSDVPAGDEWAGRTGFVHQAVMDDFADLSAHQVYACGAPLMVDAARRDFVALRGLPEHEFLADAFITQAELAQAV
ncbi:MAG: CDP-6-deoxy-delta-3,4-glucoseen reductase [Polaromonas sp.]|nr:CDP-6-deoxy-delta-3,4-glucoseen reductase [Polaromonas sp.]